MPAVVLAVALGGASAVAGPKEKRPPEVGAQAAGMLMPDLGKVLGPGWTVPPELSDRAVPGVVLEVSPAGYKRVMAGCVGAQPSQSSVTDVSLSSSLAGGVGWGGGGLGATATASQVLKLQFNNPTIHAYDLVEFAPSRDCVAKLQALAARGGVDPSRWVVVQEALMARVSGCEQRAVGASVGLPGGGASAAAGGVCEMVSDAPVAVGVKVVSVAEIPELAVLGAQRGGVAPVVAAPAPAVSAVTGPPTLSAPAPAPAQAAPAAVVSAPPAAPAQRAPTRAGDRVVGASGYALRLVPAGSYALGCTPGQGGACAGDEGPARKVTLSKAVLVGETEVTQALYKDLMGSNPSRATSCGGSCPVEQLSWLDAAKLANKLSAAEGLEACYTISGESVSWGKGVACKGYRLPTEAEWEAAARGGRDELYPGGREPDAAAWTSGNAGDKPHAVAGLAPNGYGLFDMGGNVGEWVWDWYDPSTSLQRAATDPLGPAAGVSKVSRGGSWRYVPAFARVSARYYDAPGGRSSGVGVRLVRTAG